MSFRRQIENHVDDCRLLDIL